MISQKDQIILSKIKFIPEIIENEPHEQDNMPSPFKDLSMEELLYLREHKELLNYLNK